MNTQKFIRAFNESRNGCNHFIRHPLGRQLIYSDGVQECFEAGTYWLSDIVATECVQPILSSTHPMGFLYAVAKAGKADLRLELEEAQWRAKRIEAVRQAEQKLQAGADIERKNRDAENKLRDARLRAALRELQSRPARPNGSGSSDVPKPAGTT